MIRTTARPAVVTAVASLGLTAAAGLLLAAPAIAGADVVRTSGELTRYAGQGPVADALPGATASVQSVATADGRTIVTLHVSGMQGLATYGAHAHTKACPDPALGDKGAGAGPHFQHELDPAVGTKGPDGTTITVSKDPVYANPRNEIWLDLTTNPAGRGHARAVVDWQFSPERRAKSVIIHEKATDTVAGNAGVAGKRVACIDVQF